MPAEAVSGCCSRLLSQDGRGGEKPPPVSSPQSLDMLKNLSISADKGFGQVAFA